MKSFLLVPALLLATIAGDVWAVMVKGGAVGTPTGGVTPAPLSIPVDQVRLRRTGQIESINIGASTIVIGGRSYIFSPSMVAVHAADPAVDKNPLKLHPGYNVYFTIVKEIAGRERVNEVWVVAPGGVTK